MSQVHLAIAFGIAIAAFALVAGAARPAADGLSNQQVEAFSAVRFALPGELTLVRTGEHRVAIDASEAQRRAIRVSVAEGVLTIATHKRGWKPQPDLSSVRIRVSYTALQKLTVVGSGTAVAESLDSPTFDLAVEGSGTAMVQSLDCQQAQFAVSGSGDLRVERLRAEASATRLSGSGNIVLTGAASAQSLQMAGSGTYQARQLDSDSAELRIIGSGTATLRASERISGTLSGSADLFYLGDPELAVNVQGSGRAVPAGA